VSVLLHGDLHPGNVLDGGPARGLVAIDPVPAWERPLLTPWTRCSGRWMTRAPGEPRSRELALALGVDHERLWAWCAAFAAMLAAGEVGRGAGAERVSALLALAP
jgi:streptomycin 6-kinase